MATGERVRWAGEERTLYLAPCGQHKVVPVQSSETHCLGDVGLEAGRAARGQFRTHLRRMDTEEMRKQLILETCLWFMWDWLEDSAKAIPGDRDTREGGLQEVIDGSSSKGGGAEWQEGQSSCDGQFNASAWLDNSPQLFNQKLI